MTNQKPVVGFLSLLLFSFFALVFMGCGSDKGPVFSGDNKFASVKALSFSPRRKYLQKGEEVSVLIKGYYRKFDCTKVTEIRLDKKGDTLAPIVSLDGAGDWTGCALISSKGEDTTLFYTSSGGSQEGKLYLSNTGGKVTDSVVRVDYQSVKLIDTLYLGGGLQSDSAAIAWIRDSLSYPCQAWFSHGAFCFSSQKDSLWISLKGYDANTSWAGCKDRYTLADSAVVADLQYIQSVVADSTLSCQAVLKR